MILAVVQIERKCVCTDIRKTNSFIVFSKLFPPIWNQIVEKCTLANCFMECNNGKMCVMWERVIVSPLFLVLFFVHSFIYKVQSIRKIYLNCSLKSFIDTPYLARWKYILLEIDTMTYCFKVCLLYVDFCVLVSFKCLKALI
jgi:hypothetical protein